MHFSADTEIADSHAEAEDLLDEYYQNLAESFHTESTAVLSVGTRFAARTFEITVSTRVSILLLYQDYMWLVLRR